ncbi:DgyrCDS10262 [Dimorphilus gyrociliatus]|uniref:DgyrCDS10262 n=1 Tax=Dimorphilus gyrociliatus TaxID=2664684 RepID=A0A7I8W1P4_9ANNE|nr:DgyrCDS10262 [Dimorphilus gyrociliatus]
MNASAYNLALFIFVLLCFEVKQHVQQLYVKSSVVKCQPCNRVKCAEVNLSCKGERTKGICGCCDKCAKVIGENCGGVYYYLGKCNQGLYCKPLIKKKNRLRKKWPEKGRCVRFITKSRRQLDEPFKDTHQCHPKCSPEYCRKRPRAICSAKSGIALFERECSAPCQLTSCRACYHESESTCNKCSPKDYKCLRLYAVCIKKMTCTRKRFPCRIKRTSVGPKKTFKCHVPQCPSSVVRQ